MCSISLILVLLCLFVHRGLSLKCFECTISDGENCADIVTNNTKIVDCSTSFYTLTIDGRGHEDPQEFRCIKTVEKTATNLSYTRRCGLQSELDICNGTTDSSMELIDCSYCTDDYCNSSVVHRSDVFCYLLLFVNLILFRCIA